MEQLIEPLDKKNVFEPFLCVFLYHTFMTHIIVAYDIGEYGAHTQEEKKRLNCIQRPKLYCYC